MGQQAICSAPSRCEDLKIASVHNIIGSTRCVCGASFGGEAVFCTRCGRRRPCPSAFAPDVRLAAWIRRRNGVESDFGEVFEEIFKSRDGVGPRHFADVLAHHGYDDGKASFAFIDRHTKSGRVGAADLEMLQIDVEDREAEGLKNLRAFLKAKYTSPAEAYRDMGKGEGDVMCKFEFAEAMRRLGFVSEDPIRLWHFLDKDYSGEVTFSEFKTMMRSAGVARKSKEPKSVTEQESIGSKDDQFVKRSSSMPPRPSSMKEERRKSKGSPVDVKLQEERRKSKDMPVDFKPQEERRKSKDMPVDFKPQEERRKSKDMPVDIKPQAS